MPIKSFILIIHLATGEAAFDDNLSEDRCHMAAEALRDGGAIELRGVGIVGVATAECFETRHGAHLEGAPQ